MDIDDFIKMLAQLFTRQEDDMATPDQPNMLPPPLPPQDTVYHNTSQFPSQQLTRDMGIYATPRSSSELIDELVRLLTPGTTDNKMIINERDRDNAKFNTKSGYLRRS